MQPLPHPTGTVLEEEMSAEPGGRLGMGAHGAPGSPSALLCSAISPGASRSLAAGQRRVNPGFHPELGFVLCLPQEHQGMMGRELWGGD